jgi:hypothetical protein
MASREAFVTYLVDTAAQSREPNARARGFSSAVDTARSLELLANLVLSLPEDDERLQMLASLTVRERRFTPGAATEHAIRRLSAASPQACDEFLSTLVQIARDDALARARSQGFLPHKRPH